MNPWDIFAWVASIALSIAITAVVLGWVIGIVRNLRKPVRPAEPPIFEGRRDDLSGSFIEASAQPRYIGFAPEE